MSFTKMLPPLSWLCLPTMLLFLTSCMVTDSEIKKEVSGIKRAEVAEKGRAMKEQDLQPQEQAASLAQSEGCSAAAKQGVSSNNNQLYTYRINGKSYSSRHPILKAGYTLDEKGMVSTGRHRLTGWLLVSSPTQPKDWSRFESVIQTDAKNYRVKAPNGDDLYCVYKSLLNASELNAVELEVLYEDEGSVAY